MHFTWGLSKRNFTIVERQVWQFWRLHKILQIFSWVCRKLWCPVKNHEDTGLHDLIVKKQEFGRVSRGPVLSWVISLHGFFAIPFTSLCLRSCNLLINLSQISSLSTNPTWLYLPRKQVPGRAIFKFEYISEYCSVSADLRIVRFFRPIKTRVRINLEQQTC